MKMINDMTDPELRIKALTRLGQCLSDMTGEEWDTVFAEAQAYNPWFTRENQVLALHAIRDEMLDEKKLRQWIAPYTWPQQFRRKKVGLILAGNIPAVGFHDVLCCLMSGHFAMIKLSEKDSVLIPFLLQKLVETDASFAQQFAFADQLKGMDAVIATGSDNTGRYFHAYFEKYPHIIRKHRNSVAVLTGSETEEQIRQLGKDIFSYFGLGCRNVSKLYVPQNYEPQMLLEVLHGFNEIVLHHKYKNNFDYNIALYLLNKVHYLNNGCIMLLENQEISSRIASLHYERYTDMNDLAARLKKDTDKIQCIVSEVSVPGFQTVDFGQSQQPVLWDYADGTDTLQFLIRL